MTFFNDENNNKSIKMTKQERKNIFMHFNDVVYKKQLLNDYIHIINKHNNSKQLLHIQNELKTKYNVTVCDISKCMKLRTHYRRGRREVKTNDNNNKQDTKYEFYCDCYHKFHHQIFHLFEMGLRSIPSEDEEKKETKENDNDNVGLAFVDEQFKTKRDLIIKQRKQCQIDDFMERYNDINNKFNIHIDSSTRIKDTKIITTETLEYTFLNGMYEHIKEGNKDIDVNKVKQYIVDDEFDSDAVKYDLEDITTSNICKQIGYGVCDTLMVNYIRNVECMSELFLFFNQQTH